MAVWRRVACWISEATRAQAHVRRSPAPTRTQVHTHACVLTHARAQKCVISITFHGKECFPERAPVLRYACIACLVTLIFRVTTCK